MKSFNVPDDLKPVTDVFEKILINCVYTSRSVFSDLIALMFHVFSSNQPNALAILRKYDPLATLGAREEAIMCGTPDCNDIGEKITDYFWKLLRMIHRHITTCRPGTLGVLYKAFAVDDPDSSEDIPEGDSLLIVVEGETVSAGNNNLFLVYHHSHPDYVRMNALRMCILNMSGLVAHCALATLETWGMWSILPNEKKYWTIRELPFEEWPEVYRRGGIRPSDDRVQ